MALLSQVSSMFIFFFFNDTATTEIYTLSLHDALPIYRLLWLPGPAHLPGPHGGERPPQARPGRHRRRGARSEEHTSELQSRQYLVCRLLLEKKKKPPRNHKSQLLVMRLRPITTPHGPP